MQHRRRVFAICAIGIFIAVFDASSAVVALPTIALAFDTDLPTAQWVIIGNGLTIAALLVPMGRLSDMIGRKRIHVVGCCLFALGAAAAALAGQVVALILARVLVGVGSAMTQGTAMAIVAASFDVRERAKVLGLQMAAVGLGAIAGPASGGVIVGTLGWRVLFAVTAVGMVAIAIAAQRVLEKRAHRPEASAPSFDVVGAILFSSALVAGLVTLTLGPGNGWRAPSTLAGAAACAVLVVAFVGVERRHPDPMLDFGLFKNSAFALGALGAVVAFMGLAATRFLTPFFLQGVKGFDPSRVGLAMMPAALVTAVVSPFAGRFADRFGVRLFANLGFAIVIVGLLPFARLTADTPTWIAVAGLMVLALGMSTFGAPNSASILNTVDAGAHGVAAGFVNLCRNMGNVIGIAFGTAVVSLTMAADGYPPTLSAVEASSDAGLFAAFTSGVSIACAALTALAVPVLVLLAAGAWLGRARRAPTGPDYS